MVYGNLFAIYPAKTKGLINGFTPGKRSLARGFFIKYQPNRLLDDMVLLQPFSPFADVLWVKYFRFFFIRHFLHNDNPSFCLRHSFFSADENQSLFIMSEPPLVLGYFQNCTGRRAQSQPFPTLSQISILH